MATLKDIWSGSNAAQGNVADTANWSGNNSFGVDKRVEDMLTGAYRSWPTGALNPRTNLSISSTVGSQAISNYMGLLTSYSDDTHLTFNQIQKHPLIQWKGQPDSDEIQTIQVKRIGSDAIIELTTLTAHGLSNGDNVNFAGFGAPHLTMNGKNNIDAKVISTTVVQLVTTADNAVFAQVSGTNFEQTDHYMTALNDGSYNGVLLHFDGDVETFATGATISVLINHGSLTGTIDGAVDTVYHLEKRSNNVYKVFTNADRSTPATITNQVNFSTDIPFSIASSGTNAAIAVNLSASGFATLRGQIQSVQTDEGNAASNKFFGFCRVKKINGTMVSSKAVPTAINTAEFFAYEFNTANNTISIFEDHGISGSPVPVTLVHGSGPITGNIEIINFWTHRNSPGKFFNPYTKTGSAIPRLSSDWDQQPILGPAGTVYDGAYSANTNKLFYKMNTNPTMFWPGIHSYNYQNSSNVKIYGNDKFDFTKLYRTGYTYTSSNVLTPTYLTAPVIGADVNSTGYLDNTYTITNPGRFKIASSGAVDGVFSSTTDCSPIVGAFKIKFKADDYVTPTPYAPDVFDTDDEWDSDGFASGAKNWPTIVAPSGIKVTMVQPTSTTRSQNGTKYVRATGIIKHQLEVSYPAMTYDKFREYEAVAQAARGQATPFYFNIRSQNDQGNLIFARTDQYKDTYNTSTLTIRNTVTTGDKLITVEGFEASKPDVFVRGEALIVGGVGSANGNIVQVINDNVDSNIFGEAKFRIAHGSNTTKSAYERIYKNPFHLIVTLGEDNIEYTVGTDGLYRFSVIFDLDEYK